MIAAPSESAPASAPAPPRAQPTGWVVRRPASADGRGGSELRIFGLAPEERLLRALRRAGCREPRVVDANAPPPAAGSVLALRGDVVVDERLVEGLRALPGTWIAVPELGPVAAHVPAERAAAACRALGSARDDALAGLHRAAVREVAPAYDAKLRKREPPYVLSADARSAAWIEERTFGAAYKGTTDLITKWVWPRPAVAVTRWCAARGVRPNAVTAWSAALTIAAALCFADGAFAAGLLCAWAMTFLDTVDGKLARVTLTSSRLGGWLDHGLDLIHPPFWYWAWGVGLGPGHAAVTAVVIAGYLAGRALEGIFLARFGFETHSWRPIDGLFRTITARRNPNLILLSVGTLGGRPDLGLVMVALWTVASLAVHALRAVQAWRLCSRGETIAPWQG